MTQPERALISHTECVIRAMHAHRENEAIQSIGASSKSP
jgi:hypothetical protein